MFDGDGAQRVNNFGTFRKYEHIILVLVHGSHNDTNDDIFILYSA